MLNLNLINGRYFSITIGEITLELEPCKLKTIRKFQKLAKNAGEDDLVDITAEILNKNKNKTVISDEMVGELDIDQMNKLLLEYFNWIAKEKTANPN